MGSEEPHINATHHPIGYITDHLPQNNKTIEGFMKLKMNSIPDAATITLSIEFMTMKSQDLRLVIRSRFSIMEEFNQTFTDQVI